MGPKFSKMGPKFSKTWTRLSKTWTRLSKTWTKLSKTRTKLSKIQSNGRVIPLNRVEHAWDPETRVCSTPLGSPTACQKRLYGWSR